MQQRNRAFQHVSWGQRNQPQMSDLRTIFAFYCVVLNAVLVVVRTMVILIALVLALIKIETL